MAELFSSPYRFVQRGTPEFEYLIVAKAYALPLPKPTEYPVTNALPLLSTFIAVALSSPLAGPLYRFVLKGTPPCACTGSREAARHASTSAAMIINGVFNRFTLS